MKATIICIIIFKLSEVVIHIVNCIKIVEMSPHHHNSQHILLNLSIHTCMLILQKPQVQPWKSPHQDSNMSWTDFHSWVERLSLVTQQYQRPDMWMWYVCQTIHKKQQGNPPKCRRRTVSPEWGDDSNFREILQDLVAVVKKPTSPPNWDALLQQPAWPAIGNAAWGTFLNWQLCDEPAPAGAKPAKVFTTQG